MTFASREVDRVWVGQVRYTAGVRDWLGRTDHYIGNAPPGCLFAVGVREAASGLAGVEIGVGPLLGLCLVSRPIARMLPQDGSMGEVTRLWLDVRCPYATASRVLRTAAVIAGQRGMASLISYHDRTRHSGCIYRKAGFRKWGVTRPPSGSGWASRDRSSATIREQSTPKRRWLLDLSTCTPPA